VIADKGRYDKRAMVFGDFYPKKEAATNPSHVNNQE
jgi:hypothetical protein